MDNTSLTAISPIDGRYHFLTKDLSEYFSESALIYYRVYTEVKWFSFLSQLSEISQLPPLEAKEEAFLDELLMQPREQIALAVKKIESSTNHDVKAVEYYVANEFKKNNNLSKNISFIHFGCTSEDINNVSYNLMIRDALNSCLSKSINTVYELLSNLISNTNDIPMISRTHGQAASPTLLGKELNVFHVRLSQALLALDEMQVYTTKFSGAVGNYNAHNLAYPNIDWKEVAGEFIHSLGLVQHQCTTQIEPHDNLCQIMLQCTRINNVLLDLAKDIWGYISLGYFHQRAIEGEVGSSTMPHKINPIDFENAEGNLGIANALFYHFASKLPISRFQRDLTDSTTMRNIGSAFAYMHIAIKSIAKGLGKIHANPDAMAQDLDNNWQLLTEGIQTLLRKYKIDNAYDKLKDLSRGKEITKESLHTWIQGLPISSTDMEMLLALKPRDYVGKK
ncbi:MAG: adenylosuccinate lyase [Francisellaceae bacterium]|jgi:adenylosuccinate lyase|nr:adenylosuccinate lyase [Francisellaceae bacterium]MBT6206613.1 adenylosuccinate lyase [Francisellaceae bacterium]MBT6539813.1 adenylosuccinate lyase [Francisellaceae bacterium]